MAARHLAGPFPGDWLEEDTKTVPVYKGRHFKAADVEEIPQIPEPVTLQVKVRPDFDADKEARLIVESIMQDLGLDYDSANDEGAEDATNVEVDGETLSEEEEEESIARMHESIAQRIASVELESAPDEESSPDSRMIRLSDDSLPSLEEAEAVAPLVVDELESTLRLDRGAIQDALEAAAQGGELDSTLALDRDAIRQAVGQAVGSAVVSHERLSVQEALSARDLIAAEESRTSEEDRIYAAAQHEHELGDSVLRRIELEERRMPFAFFARIGAAVSRLFRRDK